MKKLLIGLLVLGSFFAIADSSNSEDLIGKKVLTKAPSGWNTIVKDATFKARVVTQLGSGEYYIEYIGLNFENPVNRFETVTTKDIYLLEGCAQNGEVCVGDDVIDTRNNYRMKVVGVKSELEVIAQYEGNPNLQIRDIRTLKLNL